MMFKYIFCTLWECAKHELFLLFFDILSKILPWILSIVYSMDVFLGVLAELNTKTLYLIIREQYYVVDEKPP